VNSLGLVYGESAVDDEASDCVDVVDVVVVGWVTGDVNGWETRSVGVNLVVLPVVRVGRDTLCKCVSWTPG